MKQTLTYGVLAWAVGFVNWASAKEDLVLPSGLEIQFYEVLTSQPDAGSIYRFRFVALGFKTEALDFEDLRTDLDYLCNDFAIPKIANAGPAPSQVIISLADRETQFGVIDPEVTQVFEAYSVENGVCIWEMF